MIKRLLRLSVILLFITGLIAGWFASQTLIEGWKYLRLNSRVTAQILKWEIKMISISHFALFATYRYCVSGQEFIGETLFASPTYLNHYAAANDLKTRQEQKIQVWYQKKRPSFSSLQKRFPKKELSNAILTCGIFIYFYFARDFLSAKQKEDTI